MKENRKRYQCPNCGWTASEELEKEHLEHCPNIWNIVPTVCQESMRQTGREIHAEASWSQSASGSEKMINGKLFQDAVSAERWCPPE